MASAEEEYLGCGSGFLFFFLPSLFSNFLGTPNIFVRQARAEGNEGFSTSRLRADCGRETDSA